MNNENPLVPVIISTYNSSRFAIETSESVKSQTYRNLELLIPEDCSTDNTVKNCENWIALNDRQFIDTRIMTSKINTGILGNANRGLMNVKGTWLKFIAADDL